MTLVPFAGCFRVLARRSTAAFAIAGVLLPVLLSAGCAVPQPRGDGRLSRVVEPKTSRSYWLYLPAPYVKADESARAARRWPLVVTFHGMKPFDNARPQALEWEQEADRFGFIVVAPQLNAPDVFGQFPVRTAHPAFRADEEATVAILDHVFATTRADRANVLATSWSSGGYTAHYMLNRHPDRFTCLAVRQSNFSASVLDEKMAERYRYHPIFIIMTQNDFAICRRESDEAIRWYSNHGFKNLYWVLLSNSGHERTPDLAADFLGRLAAVQPSEPPTALAKRQALDGNPEGLAMLAGRGAVAAPALASVTPAPTVPAVAAPPLRRAPELVYAAPAATPPRPGAGSLSAPPGGYSVFQEPPNALVSTSAAPAQPERPVPPRSPVSIRVSSAIGIEPLYLGYSADVPVDWQRSATFAWTLNGEPIGNSINGQRTVSDAGEHTLRVEVTTRDGKQHAAERTVRVLPRVPNSGVSASGTQ